MTGQKSYIFPLPYSNAKKFKSLFYHSISHARNDFMFSVFMWSSVCFRKRLTYLLAQDIKSQSSYDNVGTMGPAAPSQCITMCLVLTSFNQKVSYVNIILDNLSQFKWVLDQISGFLLKLICVKNNKFFISP